MTKKKVLIFGNLVQVPENATEIVKLNMKVEGTAGVIYGEKRYHLEITFLVNEKPVTEKFLIAVGICTACPGNSKWFNKELFESLEKEGFLEKHKAELSAFLMDMYEKGEVKVMDMRDKLDRMFKVK